MRWLFALLLGAALGWIAVLAGLPLPWMLGPMIGCTLAAMVRLPVRGPNALRHIVVPVIGVMLGSGVTAEVLAGVTRWTGTMALLIPFIIGAAAASYAVYRRIGRFDHATAWFCAMPGGLNDMMIMGAAVGGDEKRIALAHASRILVVIVLVVLFYGLVLDVPTTGAVRGWTPIDALGLRDWVVLGLCAGAGAVLGNVLGLPAPMVFGPLILSAVAHVSGIVSTAPPTIIVNAAQVVVGTVVGCRFIGTAPGAVLRDLGLGALASSAMIGVAVVFAIIANKLTSVDLAQTFLAFSPGGLTEMSLLALAMGQDVAYVTTAHVVRLVIVIGGAGWAFRWVGGRA